MHNVVHSAEDWARVLASRANDLERCCEKGKRDEGVLARRVRRQKVKVAISMIHLGSQIMLHGEPHVGETKQAENLLRLA